MNDLQLTIAEWLKSARKAAGLSQDALGAQLALQLGDARGFTKANISHWETRKHSPNLRQMMAIAKITGQALPQEIVAGAVGTEVESDDAQALMPGSTRVTSTADAEGGFRAIPIIDIRVSAGVTGFVAEQPRGGERKIIVSEDWIRERRYNPSLLIGATVSGSSMESTLFEGDRILVYLGSDRPVSGKAFVVNFDGEACVKRLLREGGAWYLTSDNPEFPKKNMRSGHAIIVGEVVLKESDRI